MTVRVKEAAKIIIEDPSAWIKKYLSAASDEYWLFLVEIRGIKDKRLSSNPTQAPNQEEEEAARTVPNNKVKKKRT